MSPTSDRYLLKREAYHVLADALGESPETVAAVHQLHRGLCRAYILGTPGHFDAVIIESPASAELMGYGHDVNALSKVGPAALFGPPVRPAPGRRPAAVAAPARQADEAGRCAVSREPPGTGRLHVRAGRGAGCSRAGRGGVGGDSGVGADSAGATRGAHGGAGSGQAYGGALQGRVSERHRHGDFAACGVSGYREFDGWV